MRILWVTTLGTVVLGVGLVTATADVSEAITGQNHSFEDVAIPCSPCSSSNPLDVPGWTHADAVGDALIWRVGYNDCCGSITVAGEGQQFVTLGGGFTGVGQGHWLQTIVGLTRGADYELRFMMANENPGISQSLTVSFPSGSSTSAQTFSAAPHSEGSYWRPSMRSKRASLWISLRTSSSMWAWTTSASTTSRPRFPNRQASF